MTAATAAKPMPTAEQLKAYADQLPEIYRDVFGVFATADPNRLYGHELAVGTVLTHLHNREKRVDWYELEAALDRLERGGFLEQRSFEVGSYAPTPLGEELIGALTGRMARRVVVPDLPKPTW